MLFVSKGSKNQNISDFKINKQKLEKKRNTKKLQGLKQAWEWVVETWV
jgi:hypothetical protein